MPSTPHSVLCRGGQIAGSGRRTVFTACGGLGGGGKIEVCLIFVSQGWGSVHYIYDNTNKTPNGVATLIYANNNIGLATNFTLPAGLLNSTSNYLISIQLDKTNSALPSSENLQGRSRTFANFNAGSFGTSTTPVYIPTITQGNVSQFNI